MCPRIFGPAPAARRNPSRPESSRPPPRARPVSPGKLIRESPLPSRPRWWGDGPRVPSGRSCAHGAVGGRYDLPYGARLHRHPRLRGGGKHTARPCASCSSPRWGTSSSGGPSFRTRRAVPGTVAHVDIDGTVAPTQGRQTDVGMAWPRGPLYLGGPAGPPRGEAPHRFPHECSEGGRGRRWPVR